MKGKYISLLLLSSLLFLLTASCTGAPAVDSSKDMDEEAAAVQTEEAVEPEDDVLRATTPPFEAVQVAIAPVVDGVISPGEWDRGLKIPLAFNHMNFVDQRMADPASLQSYWSLQFKDDVIYGYVYRKDDVLVDNNADAWTNDNVEVFINFDNKFSQLRCVVGKSWEYAFYFAQDKLAMEGIWNEDGTIFEFSLQYPGGDLLGRIIYWNICITDNDGAEEKQFYPVYGHNTAWEGLELALLSFIAEPYTEPIEEE